VHSPDQIFRDGLDNMEDGKCYSLNPARGVQYGWMNTNAQDSWWWREVDCETGDKVDRNRIGACPGFPLDNVPSNPQNACFAYEGSCYKCNPARGPECLNSWLWQGTFTSANVGWWYERVDCNNPFGEEDDCPDVVLYKKGNVGFGTEELVREKYYSDEFKSVGEYFDLLGRKSSHFSKKKRVVYRKKTIDSNIKYQSEEKHESLSNLNTMITYLCGFSRDKWKCVRNTEVTSLKKNGDDANVCGVLGFDYGIIENGEKVGGITCAAVEVNVVKAQISKQNIVGKCRDGSRKMNVSVDVQIAASFIKNNPYWVQKGYKFSDGSVVTEENEHAMRQHEYGHKFFNSCINLSSDEFEIILDCVCESQLEEKFSAERDQAVNKIAQKIETLLNKQGDLFHSIYGKTGYAESYSCPSK
jgi:hypothetical protein